MEDALAQRKTKVVQYLKQKKIWLVYFVLAFIAGVGYYIRTRNLSLLIDATTGNYFPSDPDAIGILRYVQYIVEHGRLMDIDYLRFYPSGFGGTVGSLNEFSLLTHLIAYFYQFLHFFNDAVTVQYADVIYPAVAFVIALLFFFLLVQKIFDWKVALLASAFLTVIPAYLFRTMSGVSDKEAMAMIFFYLALYSFFAFFLEKNLKKAVVFSVVAGLASGCLWWLWGGISFLLVTVGTFVFLLVLLEKLSYRNLCLYTLYLFFTLLVLYTGFPARGDVSGLLTSMTSGIMFFALAFGWLHYVIFTKNLLGLKAKITKIPHSFVTLSILLVFGVVAVTILYGYHFIPERILDVYIDMTEPFGRNRWALTVAESRQPYFVDWIVQFTWKYLYLVFGGAVLLFYEGIKHLDLKLQSHALQSDTVETVPKKRSFRSSVYTLTIAYAIFLIAFSMSRYSGSAAVFNGTSYYSILAYVGSLFVFIAYLVYTMYSYYKVNPEGYQTFIAELSLSPLFLSIFLFFLIIGARSAMRLFFVFAPITAILAAYFVFTIFSYILKFKEKLVHYGAGITLAIFIILMLNGFVEGSIAEASATGMGYNVQWQYAMDWVRENTPTDAVFAHWWDYGYYVQTGGERATVSDGGNAHPAINYFIGRHLLTGQNDTEALQILAAKNVTHVLVVSDEIGKYSAFSSIGSDANYDRFSWIPAYSLDLGQTQELDEKINLVYVGGTALDDDFVYNDILFPANQAGIGGFIVPANKDASGVVSGFEQPTAVIVYGTQFYNVPLRCLFVNGQELIFEQDGLEACLQIIPSIEGQTQNQLGGALYLSHDVWNAWFTRYYLFGDISENFKQV